ncbi:dihydroxyacetone kinase subunit DhaK [Pantoea sp. Mb-10]|uniref:dihydroxyacetone kinase subunit DhaK n=1 Tax=unclassified Pantoea TaxID=2630326 RepID=UPI001E3B9882|nr:MULTISPECIES: dihydroxyacetone kinase subunit DhaK [unclassified Pantoea]MCE0490253.1 dihydroxyacetone kinase subunit DhaK [Pantoea sp. Mb-10]MCE0501384.1 dihydroxyacetone kinase subunit DhaK [Pantoea sp. Pb-8]
MSPFFMHEKNNLVNEAIEGILLSTPWHNLRRLDLGDEIRVVVRADWDKSKVALISGGGSGHEPAHAGFVGRGMLTAAVCGDIFASPSVDAVLNAIINVTGDAGCLLIVKNYTGDRLNFGLAAEKAKNLGYKVELVTVSDDIALPDNPQPRGIAGTALVHKIAGYAAEHNHTLEEVKALAERAIAATFSIGLAFGTCHIPGETRDERVAAGHSELGMGIHGEPGVITLDTQNSRNISSIMTDKLAQALPDGKQALLLINNLGGFSQLELALLTREVLQTPLAARITHVIGPATLVSALDMKGFSLTLLALEEPFLTALNAPVQVLGWAPVYDFAPINLQAASRVESLIDFDPSENAQVAHAVARVTQTLIDLESELNALDAKVGDGDTGSTFAAGAKKIQRGLQEKQLPLNEVPTLLALIGEQLASVMGGSSGVLMSILFTSAGQQLEEGSALPQALMHGLERMKHYGGAEPGHRTLVDALQPALEALVAGESLEAAARAAAQGAAATASMVQAKAGRSAYLNQHSLDGVKDPGAYAIEQVFAALAR